MELLQSDPPFLCENLLFYQTRVMWRFCCPACKSRDAQSQHAITKMNRLTTHVVLRKQFDLARHLLHRGDDFIAKSQSQKWHHAVQWSLLYMRDRGTNIPCYGNPTDYIPLVLCLFVFQVTSLFACTHLQGVFWASVSREGDERLPLWSMISWYGWYEVSVGSVHDNAVTQISSFLWKEVKWTRLWGADHLTTHTVVRCTWL